MDEVDEIQQIAGVGLAAVDVDFFVSDRHVNVDFVITGQHGQR